MKYVKVEWSEIQNYMDREDYNENVYYDPRKICWFIPENWTKEEEVEEIWCDIGDLEDALG